MIKKSLKFKINDINFTLSLINLQITILEACLNNGIYIPHFCYNKYLMIAGNCRICIVEIEKFIKPIISCLNLCIDNLKIYTNSFALKKFRENVLEFLLINHPLDCPICDQAGECDLQEQTLKYGLDKSRYFFFKKTNTDIYLNNNIKLILNRCILCIRCIRFLRETNINNSYFNILGTVGRGSLSKIHLYTNNKLEISGSSNIIDLCPVGALTLKLNQFSARPWELFSLLGIDYFDSFGGPLVLQLKGDKLLRVLPSLDKIFSFEFISDFSRYNIQYFQNKIEFNLNENDLQYTDAFIFINMNDNPIESCQSFLNNYKETNMYTNDKSFVDSTPEYFNFNNNYLLFKNFLKELKKKILINITLKDKMYRFFVYLNEIFKKYNNINYYNTEDSKILNFYDILFLKDTLLFINKFLNKYNKRNYIYLLETLSILKHLLNLETMYRFKFKFINYNLVKNIFFFDFNEINLPKMTNFYHFINNLNKKQYDFINVFNIFGENLNIFFFSEKFKMIFDPNNYSLFFFFQRNIITKNKI